MHGLENSIHTPLLLVVLLAFGAEWPLEMGRPLGSRMRGLKDALRGAPGG